MCFEFCSEYMNKWWMVSWMIERVKQLFHPWSHHNWQTPTWGASSSGLSYFWFWYQKCYRLDPEGINMSTIALKMFSPVDSFTLYSWHHHPRLPSPLEASAHPTKNDPVPDRHRQPVGQERKMKFLSSDYFLFTLLSNYCALFDKKHQKHTRYFSS